MMTTNDHSCDDDRCIPYSLDWDGLRTSDVFESDVDLTSLKSLLYVTANAHFDGKKIPDFVQGKFNDLESLLRSLALEDLGASIIVKPGDASDPKSWEITIDDFICNGEGKNLGVGVSIMLYMLCSMYGVNCKVSGLNNDGFRVVEKLKDLDNGDSVWMYAADEGAGVQDMTRAIYVFEPVTEESCSYRKFKASYDIESNSFIDANEDKLEIDYNPPDMQDSIKHVAELKDKLSAADTVDAPKYKATKRRSKRK